MYSASAFAANTLIWSAVAASFPLFTNQLFNNVSYGLFFLFESNTHCVGCNSWESTGRLHCTSMVAVSFLVL